MAKLKSLNSFEREARELWCATCGAMADLADLTGFLEEVYDHGWEAMFERFLRIYSMHCDEDDGRPSGAAGVERRRACMVRKLSQTEGCAARVRLVCDWLLPEPFRALMPAMPSPMTEKMVEESDSQRTRGDEEHGRRRFARAARLHTIALARAPPASEAALLAYAARSAALFELGRLEACRRDVDRALALLPPDAPDGDPLKLELEKRKRDCGAPPGRLPDDDGPFALAGKPRADVPCASDAVEIVHSDRFGRHVVAARDISAGETVSLERAHPIVVLDPHRLSRCHRCGLDGDAMLPCDGCSRVVFCDERCRAEARDTHAYECPVTPVLAEMRFDERQRLALLAVLKERARHASWRQFREAVAEIEAVEDPLAKGFVVVRDESGAQTKVFDSNNFATMHSLATGSHMRNGEELLIKAFGAAMMLYFLKYSSTFFDDCPEDDISSADGNFWFVGGLFLHLAMAADINMQSLRCRSGDRGTRFGAGIYPFSSLPNHSCAPNVCGVTVGVKLALVAIRPIKKGQQLFNSYGRNHYTDPKIERRSHLESVYKFNCVCEACANDWPLYDGLQNPKFEDKSLKKIVKFLNGNISENLRNGDKTLALSTLNKLYENISKLEPYYPCRAIGRYERLIKDCWKLCGYIVNSD